VSSGCCVGSGGAELAPSRHVVFSFFFSFCCVPLLYRTRHVDVCTAASARAVFAAVHGSVFLRSFKHLGVFCTNLPSLSRPGESIADVISLLSEVLNRDHTSAAAVDTVLAPLVDAAGKVSLPSSQQQALDALVHDTARVLRTLRPLAVSNGTLEVEALLTPTLSSPTGDGYSGGGGGGGGPHVPRL